MNAGTANVNARPAPTPASGSGQAQSEGNRGSILYNLSGSAGLLGGGNRVISNPFS